MLDTLLASLTDGILLGFVYGLAAMGLALIWGVMNVINLAHGPIIALGMFGAYFFFTSTGMNPYLAILPVGAFGLLLGIAIYFLAVHRVINAPHLSTLLATFAVNMIIIGLGTAALTTTPRNIDFSLGSFTVGPARILWNRLAAALATVVIAGLLYVFLQRTRPGKHIRAVTDNRAAAELMGIPSARVLALTFGLGSMLATIAGALIATLFPFNILSGGGYELKSFLIGVLGSLGNPFGALLGGLVLGALEGLLPGVVPPTWVPVFEFVFFVLILLWRPTGLLGSRR
jgi:branched-subunit amino acid ABC-type transport system permease component